MIPLSLALLSLVLLALGLAALWTLRDVALRLYTGSEAREAIERAKAAEASLLEARAAIETQAAELARALGARVEAAERVVERVKVEHEGIKARIVMGSQGRGR